MSEIEHLLSVQNQAGESPHWNAEKKELFWADIVDPHVYKYTTKDKQLQKFPLDIPVTGLGLRESGGLILASKSGLFLADPNLSQLSFLIDPEKNKPGVRFNDGLVDPQGRYWAGSLNEVDFSAADGSLYCLTPGGELSTMDSMLKGPNGMGWSPDHKTMYLVDCFAQLIYSYDFDPEEGQISNRRIFAEIPAVNGMPDGLTVDSDGFIWNAHWGGWRVTRYDPDGKIEREIKLPVQNVTSCIFGGEDLGELYITTAWFLLSEDERKEQPFAGDVFRVRPGVTGLPDPKFAG
ncbi:MAG: SMP-30/gluconolactonase/LRE family protein [Chloroflexi bacterium]|nr:SMP-30/gluconolactonase/LRE family protein [Chloroflexota bacterium]